MFARFLISIFNPIYKISQRLLAPLDLAKIRLKLRVTLLERLSFVKVCDMDLCIGWEGGEGATGGSGGGSPG